MNLSPHFTLRELTKSDTAIRKGIDNTPDDESVEFLTIVCNQILEPVRKHFKTPFSPLSGYRAKELNEAVGGSRKSQHMDGSAVDFEIPGVSNLELSHWVYENLLFDQLILENYDKSDPNSGWVHVSLLEFNNRSDCLTYSSGEYRSGLPAYISLKPKEHESILSCIGYLWNKGI